MQRVSPGPRSLYALAYVYTSKGLTGHVAMAFTNNAYYSDYILAYQSHVPDKTRSVMDADGNIYEIKPERLGSVKTKMLDGKERSLLIDRYCSQRNRTREQDVETFGQPEILSLVINASRSYQYGFNRFLLKDLDTGLTPQGPLLPYVLTDVPPYKRLNCITTFLDMFKAGLEDEQRLVFVNAAVNAPELQSELRREQGNVKDLVKMYEAKAWDISGETELERLFDYVTEHLFQVTDVRAAVKAHTEAARRPDLGFE